jgi:ACS family hexuronate transporter-like MFS transporter
MSEAQPGPPLPPQSHARLPPAARWFVTSFFLISSALNYLDRLLLASLAPVLMVEFHLSKVGYANLLAAFSVTYALGSPILGYWMDRAGLTAISTLAVGIWSSAGMATGLVHSATQLLWCRIGLGAAEAGGIPGTGKVYGTYLLPKERALGAGVGQLAISAGSLAAPLLAAWSLRHGDWRVAFEIAGGLGLFWILGWFAVSRRFPPHDSHQPASSLARRAGDLALLRDARFWRLLGANFLWMSIYTLWPNWTTVLLTTQFPLSAEAANRVYAWIPPLGATFGALLGGALSMRFISAGTPEVRARLRVCWLTAVLSLVTAAVPFAGSPTLAIAGIAASYCFVAAGSTNLYTLPVDLWGASRAGFAIAGLVASFGASGFVFNPLFGWLIQRSGNFQVVCLGVAALPLLAFAGVASLGRGEPDPAQRLPQRTAS